MKDSISMSWLGDMAFETEINGHKLILDATEKVGGKDRGPRPKAMMMVALAGCTGMDVVSILAKMRVDYDSLNIRVDSELSEEHPKRYTKMKLIYEFKGKNLSLDKVKKAVELSQEKYCGVSANYREAMDLDYEIKIL